MKIAIALEGNDVATHFGHCSQFGLVDIADGQVKERNIIDNPGHIPGFLPKFLAEKNVECVITGGIGAKALDLFAEHGIKVITVNKGSMQEVLENFLKGELISTKTVCQEHAHAGSCGGHHD